MLAESYVSGFQGVISVLDLSFVGNAIAVFGVALSGFLKLKAVVSVYVEGDAASGEIAYSITAFSFVTEPSIFTEPLRLSVEEGEE